MPYAAFKDTYFKAMIKAAKGGKRVSYAYGEAKDGEPDCFVLDDALVPEALFNKVKSEKGLSKGGFGFCRMEGSSLALSPSRKYTGLKKILSGLAKEHGWPVKQFKVVGEEDGAEESGESEAGETPSGGETPPAAPPQPETPAAGVGEAEAPETETGEAEEETPAAGGLTPEQMRRKAETIRKAALAWNKSTEAATKALRKLQKAILDTRDPNAAPVIQALEGILRRLDRIDEEAEEAAAAAAAGDAEAFNREANDLRAKVRDIAGRVATDEVIRDADDNPFVPVNIGKVLNTALTAILKSIR